MRSTALLPLGQPVEAIKALASKSFNKSAADAHPLVMSFWYPSKGQRGR